MLLLVSEMLIKKHSAKFDASRLMVRYDLQDNLKTKEEIHNAAELTP